MSRNRTSRENPGDPQTEEQEDESAFVKFAKFAGKCVVGAGVALGVVSAILPVLGFGSSGVRAGSVAASYHSSIGDVPAGSTFAKLQSVGARGLSTETKTAVLAVGATCGAAFL